MIDKFYNSDITLCSDCKILPIPRGIKACPICLTNAMRADLLMCADCAREGYCRRCGKKIGGEIKTCYINNDRFSWVLRVDGFEVPFQGHENAEYFKEHYEALGYEVIIR